MKTPKQNAQMIELGAATKLTLGYSGPYNEGANRQWGGVLSYTPTLEQVTELGTATDLTLGNRVGNKYEGMSGYRMGRTETPIQITELGAATKLTRGHGGKSFEGLLCAPRR